MMEKLDFHLQETLPSIQKINSKWITDLNVKCKTIKPLQDIGDNLDDLGYGSGF